MPTLNKKELLRDRAQLKQSISEFKHAATPSEQAAATNNIIKTVLKSTKQDLQDGATKDRQRFAGMVAALNPGRVHNLGIEAVVQSHFTSDSPLEVPAVVLKRLDSLV